MKSSVPVKNLNFDYFLKPLDRLAKGKNCNVAFFVFYFKCLKNDHFNPTKKLQYKYEYNPKEYQSLFSVLNCFKTIGKQWNSYVLFNIYSQLIFIQQKNMEHSERINTSWFVRGFKKILYSFELHQKSTTISNFIKYVCA